MTLALKRLPPEGFPDYARMTTAAYQVNYGDVDVSMAEHILDSHQNGRDLRGYMTLRKEVLTTHIDGKLVGFTTLTWKRGGSVKTGPTILFPDSRGQGIGPMLQREIQKYVSLNGGRKTYGTVSDANERACRYMLKAGYEIEAALKDHYQVGKNEIVFGKLLVTPPPRTDDQKSGSINVGDLWVETAGRLEIQRLSVPLIELFDRFLVSADETLVANLASSMERDLRDFAGKPKRVFLVRADQTLKGAVVFAPKRGGSVKANVLGDLGPEAFLATLVKLMPRFQESGFRKISVFVPPCLTALEEGLLARGWVREGRLREPYKVGVDVAIISRFVNGLP